MKLGIVGLPNVGKSTLFNAITKAGAEAANYPFCTIEPNVGVVTVPDERLKVLHEMYNSKKTIYTTIEFYDIAGLVKGASKGEGLGNKFLGHIREVAAIVHVVRCFEDANVVHVDGKIDPISDIDTINTELILSDMEVLERRIQKTTKNVKGDKSLQKELDLLNKVHAFLGEGKSARAMELEDDEAEFVKSLDLLSYKPVIYAANVSEDDAVGEDNEYIRKVRKFSSDRKLRRCSRMRQDRIGNGGAGRRRKGYVPGRTGYRKIRTGQAGAGFLPFAGSDLLPDGGRTGS